MGMNGVVKAAGGLVTRGGRNGPEILLVHRPRYDDWTFPKGKLDAGESDEACALREVQEETGIRCDLIKELASTSYTDHKGRSKIVRYWDMRPVEGKFQPNEEVDEVRWVSLADSPKLLSYAHDRKMMKSLNGLFAPADPLFLLRHGSAGKREQFDGDDKERPLDGKGKAHAEALTNLLGEVPIGRIISSPYLRCVQTVQPLSKQTGIDIEVRPELAEGAKLEEIEALLDEMEGTHAVLCTHGDVILSVIGHDRPAKKGSVWMLERKTPGEPFRPVGYLPPPRKG